MVNKKIILVGALGVVGWYAWRSFNNIDTDVYSANDGGGFYKVEANFRDLIMVNELKNKEKFISNQYFIKLKEIEVLKKSAYQASDYERKNNIFTIGYGHVIVKGDGLSKNSVLSEVQADNILLLDLESKAKYTRMVEPELNQAQFDAVTDFIFNVGQGHFLGVSKLTKKYGVNPINAFNDKGVTAGFAEMVRYYSLLSGRSDYKGLSRRSQFQQGMAGRGVYQF